MKIVVDSREQRPLTFGPDIDTITGTLRSGDYSLAGFEELVAVERKEFSDFIGCCGPERSRFKAELQRLKAYNAKAVVIEADLNNILTGAYRSRIQPESVLGSVASWTLRYGVPFMFTGNREGATRFILALFRNYLTQIAERDKALRQQMEVVGES